MNRFYSEGSRSVGLIMRKVDPFAMSWGEVCPEYVSEDNTYATHVLNVNLSTEEQVERALRFIRGRLLYYAAHLPKDMQQDVFIDDRGLRLSQSTRDRIAREVSKLATGLHFMSENPER